MEKLIKHLSMLESITSNSENMRRHLKIYIMYTIDDAFYLILSNSWIF